MFQFNLSWMPQGPRFSTFILGVLLSTAGLSAARPAAAQRSSATATVPESCKVQSSKPGSIQQAVDSGCTTVLLSSGKYRENLVIPIGRSVSIESTSANTIIDGGGTGTVVRVREGAEVTLKGLTIQNGNDYNGGIRNYKASLTLINSRITNNLSVLGGGIYNYDGTVSLIDSTIENNSAAYGGGGIFTESGTVTLSNSVVTSNYADSVGGGIFNNEGTITIDGSSVTNNEAGFQGGGIFNNKGTLTLTDSLVTGNAAGDNGGGIQNLLGAYSIQSSTVIGNSPNNIAGDPSMS